VMFACRLKCSHFLEAKSSEPRQAAGIGIGES